MDMYYMMSIIMLFALGYGLISFLVFLFFSEFEDDKLEKERMIAYSILWAPYLVVWIVINIVKGMNLLIADIMTGYFYNK